MVLLSSFVDTIELLVVIGPDMRVSERIFRYNSKRVIYTPRGKNLIQLDII